jgi:hypothetical protein
MQKRAVKNTLKFGKYKKTNFWQRKLLQYYFTIIYCQKFVFFMLFKIQNIFYGTFLHILHPYISINIFTILLGWARASRSMRCVSPGATTRCFLMLLRVSSVVIERHVAQEKLILSVCSFFWNVLSHVWSHFEDLNKTKTTVKTGSYLNTRFKSYFSFRNQI